MTRFLRARGPALLFGLLVAAPLLAAADDPVGTDPAPDAQHPPQMSEMSLPSHGATLYGVYYQAGGAGVHPTVLLLHGFAGFEQNEDLAQALRRAGFNVLIF